MPINTMTIAHREQPQSIDIAHVLLDNEGILVWLPCGPLFGFHTEAEDVVRHRFRRTVRVVGQARERGAHGSVQVKG